MKPEAAETRRETHCMIHGCLLTIDGLCARHIMEGRDVVEAENAALRRRITELEGAVKALQALEWSAAVDDHEYVSDGIREVKSAACPACLNTALYGKHENDCYIGGALAKGGTGSYRVTHENSLTITGAMKPEAAETLMAEAQYWRDKALVAEFVASDAEARLRELQTVAGWMVRDKCYKPYYPYYYAAHSRECNDATLIAALLRSARWYKA